MEHVVFFPGPDSTPSCQRFATLEEAVGFVEHLRNAEDVSEVSVHALTPVPLAFRAYYKVEVPVADLPMAPAPVEVPLQAGEPVAALPVEPDAAPDVMPELDEVVAGPVDDGQPALVPAAPDAEPSSNGKRSLGFFAH
jgi:hypothetical protein